MTILIISNDEIHNIIKIVKSLEDSCLLLGVTETVQNEVKEQKGGFLISNDEIHDIIKIVKSLEGSGLLIEGVTKTVQNEVKEQKVGFLSMLLATLGASLLGNLLTSKGIDRAGKGKWVVRAGYENNNNNNMDF